MIKDGKKVEINISFMITCDCGTRTVADLALPSHTNMKISQRITSYRSLKFSYGQHPGRDCNAASFTFPFASVHTDSGLTGPVVK